jgi:hypothetical protein
MMFKCGVINKEHSKSVFLEVVFPYHYKYEELTDYVYDVLGTIFNDSNMNLKEFCLFEEYEKLYNEKKLSVNNHYEYLQYVSLLLKKK